MVKIENYFFYVLLCSNGAFYAGTTNNLNHRIKTHNLGKGAKYTRSHLPVSLIYYKIFPDKGSALSFEIKFKKLNRLQKEKYLQKHCNCFKKSV